MRSLPVGGFVAALVMFFLGFCFYALGGTMMFSPLDPGAATALQGAVATVLTESGTYAAPADEAAFMQGPSAIVQFIAAGDVPNEMWAMGLGFLHMLVSSLLLGLCLQAVGGDAGRRIRVALWLGLAASVFSHLGDPLWYGFGWRASLFEFVADGMMFTAAGLVLAKWFTGDTAATA